VDYLFEQLGPETFQEFCQALLVPFYPNLQSFPVGQPDGGRDALSRAEGELPTVVAQVKFKRADEDDNAGWMIKALEAELPKIERLQERGAERYLMMTNASGTAHPETGRIDRVQAWLEEHCPIPAEVFWREDLARRLDDRNDLKLAYPAMLTGQNTLTLIYEAMFANQRAHLARVVKLFVDYQYIRDSEVKFRQVDLANSLTALFVDVPANARALISHVRHRGRVTQFAATARVTAVTRLFRPMNVRRGEVYSEGLSHSAGTADLLLSADVQAMAPKVVLQGAPGQGKSTIAQYVCQVHRARLLGRESFLETVEERHRAAPFRLPIKVDLRDLASFVDGREYLHRPGETVEAHRTFERFLAAMIAIQSDSDSFSVDDLRVVLTETPALLFLDGLDEVADMRLRERMLERVDEGLHRLSEIEADVQVVITSRPAQLGQTAKIPNEFVRINMAPLGSDTVEKYAQKWTAAKGLDPERTAEVMAILSSKLDLEHIRELTKNPMQLTILLTLIHQIGHSLPDARTDLYREYVALFMTREAEKDAVVRTHKALLLQIVEYLAWELQSKAEADGGDGSISAQDLKQLVARYLQKASRDDSILDQLFERGLDRIYVLVQRVEGLYEFEVQPLREYFAAKYLYSTAPMGTYRTRVVNGDRLQRFEAIAANPYWANVTRFYAGFWEQGEVVALASSLRELIADGTLEQSLNARSIGAALLTDRAFSTKLYAQNEVVDAIFDNIGVHLGALSRLNEAEPVALGRETGRDRLADIIFEQHICREGAQVYGAVCYVLRRHNPTRLGPRFDSWIAEASGSTRTRRIKLAALSGALNAHSADDLVQLITGDNVEDRSVLAARRRAVYAGADSEALNDRRLFDAAYSEVLDFGGYTAFSPTNELAVLASVLDTPFSYSEWTEPDGESLLPDGVSQMLRDSTAALRALTHGEYDEAVIACTRILEEQLRGTWALYRYALESEGRLTAKRPVASGEIRELSVLDQIARGRRWGGRTSWWQERFDGAQGDTRLFWIAVLLAWAQSSQVQAALSLLEEQVADLSPADVERLEDVLETIEENRRFRSTRRRSPVAVPPDVTGRLARLLVIAFGHNQVRQVPKRIREAPDFDRVVKLDKLVDSLSKFPGWEEIAPRAVSIWLARLREAHDLRYPITGEIDRRFADWRAIPVAAATRIVRDATSYPMDMVVTAVGAVQRSYKPASVRSVALDQAWEF